MIRWMAGSSPHPGPPILCGPAKGEGGAGRAGAPSRMGMARAGPGPGVGGEAAAGVSRGSGSGVKLSWSCRVCGGVGAGGSRDNV